MPSAAAGCCGCRLALGLGIAVYFQLPSEPVLCVGPAVAAAALILVFFASAGSLGRAVATGLVAAAVGFG
jgi:competence protein ComEC